MATDKTSGVPLEAKPPEIRLAELAERALARPAEQPAIEFEQKWIDWGAMRCVSTSLREALSASGAPPGAPVAFVPRNRPAAIAALLGLIAARTTVRMIYAFQSPAAIARDVQRLQAAVLVADVADFTDEIRAMLRESGIAGIALNGMQACAFAGHEHVHASVQTPEPPRIEILTSGTTGAPKQFPVSYELIMRHHVGTLTDLSNEKPTLLFFPLGNITGLYSTLPPLLKGQRAVLLDRFTVAGWHDYVVRYRPDAAGLPPAGVQMVLEAQLPAADLASIRRLGTGAAPLDPGVHRGFEARYGIPILLSYGATEFGGPVAAMTLDLHAHWGEKKFGSVGRALPGAQLRVIDADTGAVLPPGTEGVLEVISPRIGAEWIRTSDIALLDEDGFLFHRGRADGAITRGGFKLLPETIERALLLHPAISAAAATGVPDPRLGEVPVVAIALKPGIEAPDLAALETHLRRHLPATHIPVQWRYVAELPRTPSLKVDRRALRRLFSADLPDA